MQYSEDDTVHMMKSCLLYILSKNRSLSFPFKVSLKLSSDSLFCWNWLLSSTVSNLWKRLLGTRRSFISLIFLKVYTAFVYFFCLISHIGLSSRQIKFG